jgi:hypothetical protein
MSTDDEASRNVINVSSGTLSKQSQREQNANQSGAIKPHTVRPATRQPRIINETHLGMKN